MEIRTQSIILGRKLLTVKFYYKNGQFDIEEVYLRYEKFYNFLLEINKNADELIIEELKKDM